MTDIAPTLAIACLFLSFACLGLAISLVHMRRRHRAARRALTRERDALIWKGPR